MFNPVASPKDDHIQRTASHHREANTINMEIIQISNLSPTVKHLVLLTREQPIPISFKAGQWVDMFIPGLDTIGGFSICSSPIHLSETGELSLCVKYSDHPPANWVHNECKLGTVVSIRVGGDFFLDTDDDKDIAGKKILLIGGGVGINPLLSIITQRMDYSNKSVDGKMVQKTCLMYSAKTKAELLFMNSLNQFELEDHTFTVQYFVTGEEDITDTDCQEGSSSFKYRRITRVDIESCVINNLGIEIGSEAANNEILVFVCGPPPMIQQVCDTFGSLGIENVRYEKWW